MIELRNLHCIKHASDDDSGKAPLEDLEVNDHVHGCFQLKPKDDAPIFNYGYWGVDDACIGDWYSVLHDLIAMAIGVDDFTYEYPYPDQGDPVVEFVFGPKSVNVRTVFYANDSGAEPERIDEVIVERGAFEAMLETGVKAIEKAITRASPTAGAAWLKRNKRG